MLRSTATNMVSTESMRLCVGVALLCGLATVVSESCPAIQVMQDFHVDKYMGVWYEIQAEDSIFQTIKSCLSSTFSRAGVDAVNVASEGRDSSGQPTSTKSRMEIPDASVPAHMVTDFVPMVKPPFDVLDTDYTTYSCVHSCLSIGGFKTEFVFIYSRNRTLDVKFVEHCRKLFQGYGIDVSKVEDTPQSNCIVKSDL